MGRKPELKNIVETLPWSIVGSFDHFEDTNGSIENIIKKLQEIKQRAETAGYTNISLSTTGGYEETIDTYVEGSRPETDKEYDKRTKENRKERERKKEEGRKKREKEKDPDYEQYIKLREKFEDE